MRRKLLHIKKFANQRLRLLSAAGKQVSVQPLQADNIRRGGPHKAFAVQIAHLLCSVGIALHIPRLPVYGRQLPDAGKPSAQNKRLFQLQPGVQFLRLAAHPYLLGLLARSQRKNGKNAAAGCLIDKLRPAVALPHLLVDHHQPQLRAHLGVFRLCARQQQQIIMLCQPQQLLQAFLLLQRAEYARCERGLHTAMLQFAAHALQLLLQLSIIVQLLHDQIGEQPVVHRVLALQHIKDRAHLAHIKNGHQRAQHKAPPRDTATRPA